MWEGKILQIYNKSKNMQNMSCVKRICTENLPCKPQTVPGKFGTIQFGNRTIWHWIIWHQINFALWQYSTGIFGTRTIWHQDYLAPYNLAPGQLGNTAIWHQDNLTPWQFRTRQYGTRTIWHQNIIPPGQFRTSAISRQTY